jgi:phage protein D
MRTPFIAVNFNGRNLVPLWGPTLISVTVSDGRGNESDTVTIEIDDLDGETEFPEPGENISVEGGYEEDGGSVQGEYEIDTIDLEGWPQKITLSGTSASAKKANKERKNEAHRKADTPTFGKLAEKIAKRNGWEAKIAKDLADIPVSYEGQSAESDVAFLTRLASRYGALAAVKQGKLVVTPKAGGKSASGGAIGGLVIAPGINLISYKASRKSKPKHDKVEASVFDRNKVKRVDVKTGGSGGEGEITYRFREPFKNEAEAKKAAEAKLSDLTRGTASATFTIEGDPSAAAEEPVTVQGVRSKVDGIWNPIKVEHKWSDSGYETTLECEVPGAKDKN